MNTATHTLRKSPKAKKIEDIVKPDATMRLHQRLFDRRRKHHIDVKEETGPGTTLSSFLVSPKYRQKRDKHKQLKSALVTSSPVPVLQYSQITRDLPIENYLEGALSRTRSFTDRITQRYRVFVSQHKPLHYSLTNGVVSGWSQNPRAGIALAGSALALLLFFTGAPSTPPTDPNNPSGQNPIVIQDTSGGTSSGTNNKQESDKPSTAPAPAATPGQAQPKTHQSTVSSVPVEEAAPSLLPAYGGGYGSGPSTTSTSGTAPVSQPSTPTQPQSSPTPIHDIVKPTPVTIPGQDIIVDDKRILQTSDTTITIN